jgi:ssDNA-binding replication factor A large subunit
LVWRVYKVYVYLDLHNNIFKWREIGFEMVDNYEQLIQRISESAKVEVSEIERKIGAKRAKLSGLVSKEGAAQIVAAELGINFDQERLKISQLVHGMRRANVVGKILDIQPIREFKKGEREGKVCSFLLADEISNTRAVLWDAHHISLIEQGKIKEGDVVEISNGGVRNGEVHLGSFSDLKKSEEKMESVIESKVYAEKKLNSVKAGETFMTRAIIVQVFEPRYFEVCPQCGKGVKEGKCNGEHGEVKGKKRALLNVVLDDGSETMRCVLFGETINKLGLSDEEIFDLNVFNGKKDGLLGEERFFSGNVRQNQLYNTIEMTIEDVVEIDVQSLVKALEAKIA